MDRFCPGDATRDRAQTAQDFALGIGFFIVAVAFVFAFVPSMLAFTTADPGAKAASQADRAATSLLRDLGTAQQPNQLNGTATAEYFNTSATEQELQSDLVLPNISYINLNVRSLDDERVVIVPDADGNDVELSAGRDYSDRQPAAEAVRIVTMTEDNNACDPACQLVVRVW